MNDKFFPELTRRLRQAGIPTGPADDKQLPVLVNGQEAMASSQAPYPSLPRRRESSVISLLLLSPSNLLRWASMGAPRKRPSAFVGRGGARERTQFSPQAETQLSGLCPDEDSGYPITREREDLLAAAANRIESSVDDLAERVEQSNRRELEAAQKQTDEPALGL